jgi:hypothetical protein
VRRERATALLVELLRGAAGDTWPVSLIRAVYVFGPYSRGALDPVDVDVAVDLGHDEQWESHVLTSMMCGRDPYSALLLALRGRSRRVSIVFDRAGRRDAPVTLLWTRGEPVVAAVARVHAIAVDPTAARAQPGVLPSCFQGPDAWVPHYLREELAALVKDGIVDVDRVLLDDVEVADPGIGGLIDSRWSAASPLHRTAHASMARLEALGADLRAVHLHGRDVGGEITPHLIGFQLRYLPSALWRFECCGGTEWLEVAHPTRHRPLVALRMSVLDRDALSRRPRGAGSYFR